MQTEIEVKFLNVDHDAIREKLRSIGAELVQPMRTMRRVTIDTDAMKQKNAFLRVRDEGDRVTMTYKQFDELSVDGAKEVELEVSDFEAAIALLDAIGLPYHSSQESRREAWKFFNTEIVLDEWPWLKPYIEIEGRSEADLQVTARQLDLDWKDAVFGDVMVAYRAEYPGLGEHDTIGNTPVARFGDPLPEFLRKAKT